MATDVERVSFDWARLYRGLAPQQGRVSLEAEQNEQRVIDSEERRKELIDIVGPAGTPDDGYSITGGPDFTIGAGTMYVGGLRVELDSPTAYSLQPDWLDRGPDPVAAGQTNEYILLTLRETDVTAVEDPVLYEVALGGPDGAGRTRLLQRVTRSATQVDNCAAALGEAETGWAADGLRFDPATMTLKSNSRLLVTWEGNPNAPDPCEPASTGGYLGAENQLIRVQIAHIDGANKTCDLLWSYDDASFLYRVTADTSPNPVLKLDRRPADDFHRPRAGQAVQVLRAAAQLQSTDGVVEGFVAALGGQVATLAAPYDPDTKTVQFPTPLPPEYTDTKQTKQLYLRVWEERLTGVAIGTPVSLTGTGIQVTITADGGGSLHVDDFWCIAVRPSTPSTVYPDRYLRTAQPPDGPRLWACPLAVIGWQTGQVSTLEDCRNHFKPLIDERAAGCCVIEVQPSDAGSGKLQALIDKAAAGRATNDRASRVTICFQPGRYELAEPIVLRKTHSNLTLAACGEAAVIAVKAGFEAALSHGLLILAEADDVTITGFEFVLPPVPIKLANYQPMKGGVFTAAVAKLLTEAIQFSGVSVGIRPVNCVGLEIDNCLFRFVPSGQSTTDVGLALPPDLFGVAVFAAGGLKGLRLRQNRFVQEVVAARHYVAGFLMTQNAVVIGGQAKAEGKVGAFRLRAIIDDAEIVDNEFQGLTAAIVIEADLGDVRVWDNVIQNCYLGVSLMDAMAAANADFVREYQVTAADLDATQFVRAAMLVGLLDPVLVTMLLLASFYPLPGLPGYVPSGVSKYDLSSLAKARQQAAALQQSTMTILIQLIEAEFPSQAEFSSFNFNAAGQASSNVPQASGNLLLLWNALLDLVRLDKPLGQLRASLRVERNNVDCVLTANKFSGPALSVFTTVMETLGGSATVGSNRLTSLQATVAAAVIGPTLAAVNENIVVAQGHGIALGVAVVRAPAITGNVVVGQTVLPSNRPFPAPLNTWLPLNTIV